MNSQTHAKPRLLAADRLKLAAVVTAPACARLFVRHVCEQWVIPDEQTDIAELLASELVTNAVEATGILGANPEYPVVHALARLIAIGVLRSERSLILEVWDTSLDSPRLLELDGDAQHGRGLQLVDSLSLRWGYYYARAGGKAVWCELALPTESVQLAYDQNTWTLQRVPEGLQALGWDTPP